MVAIYRQGMLTQSAPEPKPAVARKSSRVEIFKQDCERLTVMWFDRNFTLDDIRKETHWNSLGQISKVARLKLSLPNRFSIKKGYAE